jgi:uncharacterized membrane protein|tara:strand:- start:3092 stop:3283 length:192 start_codon:yes stop_codon:yes gene_type:complete
MLTWLKARLKEKSTQTAVVGALVWGGAHFGLELTVEQQLQLATVVAFVFGLIVTVLKEKDSED